jgi:hypothetical protein
MTKTSLLAVSLALAACGTVAAESVTAKGAGATPGGNDGVTVRGSAYRYTALSPSAHGLRPTDPRNHNRNRVTVVTRTDRDGGRVSRWWYLRGNYGVPGVAYDGTAGGLSANGRRLVLSRFSAIFPPRVSGFAILDTRLHLRHPVRPGQHRPPHAITRVNLHGGFSFDAISPDGSTIFLIQHLSRNANITDYRVRALDTGSGRLLPRPIVDPDEPDERMGGLPISRANSPNGRWAYTLYDGGKHEPFIHALDTVGKRAVCIDLPQLEGLRDRLPDYAFLYRLKMKTARQGRELIVLSRGPQPQRATPLLTVDTTSFEVAEAEADPVAAGATGDLPWLALCLVSLAFVVGIVWMVGKGRQGTGGTRPKRA